MFITTPAALPCKTAAWPCTAAEGQCSVAHHLSPCAVEVELVGRVHVLNQLLHQRHLLNYTAWGYAYCSITWHGVKPLYTSQGTFKSASGVAVFMSVQSNSMGQSESQIKNMMVSSFFITEFYHTKVTSEPHCIS